MEVFTISYFVTLCLISVNAYNLNLTSCRSCSNRVDVPCYIQELHYSCIHDEFDGIWPGVPRNLSSRGVKISKDVMVANFTWNAPYDASYRTLNGFLLTVNIAEDYILHRTRYTLPQLPICFFANLSGTNWDTVPKPHSVLFHFDCVTSNNQNTVEVSLTLKSSPVPGEKSLTPLSKSVKLVPAKIEFIQGLQRHRRDFSFHSINRILIPSSRVQPIQKTESMAINFTVMGTTVKIKFGPIQHNYTYRVCLSTVSKEYECYKYLETSMGQDSVTFTDVNPDTYRIYIQKLPDPDNPMFVTKPFNVTAPPSPERPTMAASTVAIITMACLLFVAGVTTLYFCLKRKRCQCTPRNWKICNCVSYQRTPFSAPNNRADDEENNSMLEILPVFYDESECFTSAVKEVCSYLSKWSKCHINYDWLSSFYENPEVSFKESYPNCLLLIFLSSKMWTFHFDHHHSVDLKTKIYNKVFIESNGKSFGRMAVSFQPFPESKERFQDIKIYRIRKQIVGHIGKRLEINTEDLYQMLKEINGVDEDVKNGWTGYEEILSLFNATKCIPERDLDCRGYSISNYDHTFDSKNIQKKLDTRIWAESQHRVCNTYCQNGYTPDIGYHQVDELGQTDKSITNEIDIDIDSASVCQDGYYPMTRRIDHVIDNHNCDWSPPEEDSESVTQSAIGQKQMEFYQRYKSHM